MSNHRDQEPRSEPHSVSLSDLEQLWGDSAQRAVADEEMRARYLECGCPLPPPPPPPAEEKIWYQPLCA